MQNINGNFIVVLPYALHVEAMIDQSGLADAPSCRKHNVLLIVNAFENVFRFGNPVAEILLRNPACQNKGIRLHIHVFYANIIILMKFC